MKKRTERANPTSTSKHDLVHIVFPSCTNAKIGFPYGFQHERACWEILIKVKLLQGIANQASPCCCTLKSSFSALRNPKISPMSCNASLDTSYPCLGGVCKNLSPGQDELRYFNQQLSSQDTPLHQHCLGRGRVSPHPN